MMERGGDSTGRQGAPWASQMTFLLSSVGLKRACLEVPIVSTREIGALMSTFWSSAASCLLQSFACPGHRRPLAWPGFSGSYSGPPLTVPSPQGKKFLGQGDMTTQCPHWSSHDHTEYPCPINSLPNQPQPWSILSWSKCSAGVCTPSPPW